MPRRTVPKYRRQRGSPQDRAFVDLGGRRRYLGAYGSNESRALYSRLIAEWEAGGRQPEAPPEGEITVMELAARFWSFAEGYYVRPDGSPARELGNYRSSLRPVKAIYGEILAKDFGPRALKAVREKLIEGGACRNYVNQSVGRIKRVFKWGVSEELIPPTVFSALETVRGLKRGRSTARESEPVRPVPAEHVEAVKPHVSRQVWALIQLQLLTGARSGELVTLRPCDLDTSGLVWVYSPAEHKTRHHGHERHIYLGPRAQDVLRPFLAGRGPGIYCFSPTEAEAERRAAAHAARKTPLSCGNAPGRNRKRHPERNPRDRYDVESYGHAIARACKKVNTIAAAAKQPGIAHWHPHQLRHSAGTSLRKEFGLDAARVILGHRSPGITEVYAELDRGKAVEIIGKIG